MNTQSSQRDLFHFRSIRSAVPAIAFALALSGPALAQGAAEVPSNIVNLSASGHKEVAQDWLTMVLGATREGPDAATVQNQLKAAMDAALAQAQAEAKPQQVEVRTGNLSLYPRYGSNGRISGWQGQAELIIEGRDTARIGALAGRIQTLTVSSMGFSLSRQARLALESEVQALAIERFRARATEVSKGFGFSGYELRDIAVSSADMPDRPVPRMMAMEAKAAMSDVAVPVAAGTATVSITVSGSVQLR